MPYNLGATPKYTGVRGILIEPQATDPMEVDALDRGKGKGKSKGKGKEKGTDKGKGKSKSTSEGNRKDDSAEELDSDSRTACRCKTAAHR